MQSPSTQNNRLKKSHAVFWGILSALLVGAAIYVWLNVQYLTDWVNYQVYDPPEAIVEINKDSGMTEAGTFAFYTAQPTLDGTRTFNAKCDRKEQNTAILGCYADNKIYIFYVNEEKLDGIHEVTAVHEMLHVVYHRMSGADKERINALLEVEAGKLEKNKEFADRMDFYARTEPGERYNELHSIIATEVSDIDEELEEHYAKYFDRQTILDLYKSYKNEFQKLEKRAEDLKKQVDTLSANIEKAKKKYADDIKDLDRDINSFNSRANNGEFDSQAQFDAERAELINRTEKLKSDRTKINSMVTKYNKLIKQHNDLITESNALYQSIDSSLAPAPSI